MAESRRRKTTEDSHRQPHCPIVGVGASAGGLVAFERLLGSVPADTPLAFVLVQHLDPYRPTQLADLLAEATVLPVVRATDGMSPTGGHVYVIPEGRIATVQEGAIRLEERGEDRGSALIDAFLTSLALHEQSGACAVLLSGMGSDGVQGMREIAAAGGLTFVQDPGTAEFDAMPKAAIAAGVADFVGSPEEIAARLHERAAHPHLAGGIEGSTDEAAFARILSLVAREEGIDFSQYKPSTVRRRIGRRAMLRNVDAVGDYLQVLERDRAEVDALVGDLLINVTQFFRDPEVFEALRERVFPEILKGKTAEDAVRIWVPGCSTGEEVYSILITLVEALDALEEKPRITVFGTDASNTAVRLAREAVYPDAIAGSVSPERLERFFEPAENGLRVAKPLRELCVFARQDITRDTPFSRLDLISMRNVLIYFEQPLQKRVLAVAHFALVPGGFLVLGSSETPDSQPKLFEAFDKRHHVYRRRDVPSHLPMDVTGPLRIPIEALAEVGVPEAHRVEPDVVGEADQVTLAAFAPARVVTDADAHVLHFFGDTRPFLEHAEGRATLDLLELTRPELALEVRDAFESARSEQVPVTREASFGSPGQRRRVSIAVLPLAAAGGPPHFLVAFEEVPYVEPPEGGPREAADLAGVYEAREERIRRELATLRGRVRTVTEEKELANQSLRAANEEVRSSNEELQSINEELETAKEELQSANEELTTVNDELRQRNEDLARLSDDLANFAASTEIPSVMVDLELRVRRSTPQAERVMHVLPTDEGRPLAHIRPRVDVPDLEEAVASVIAEQRPIEREVRAEDGRWYSLRVLPYRSSAGDVEGAVLSFIDIDELKHTVERTERRARLAEVLNQIDQVITSALEADTIMQQALDLGALALGADAGTIALHENGTWHTRYQYGLEDAVVGSRRTDEEAPVATLALNERAPVMVADLSAAPALENEFARSRGLTSVLALPLLEKQRAFGSLVFYRRGVARAFLDGEVDFGRKLASAVSLALANARLLEAERKAARLAESLNKVNDILRTALTPAEVLSRLVGEASEVAGADKSLVIEVRDGTFTVTHVRGIREDLVVGVAKPSEYYPAYATAASERRVVLIGDNWNDPRTNKEFVVPHELRAFQLMPIVVDDEVVAVIAFAYDEPKSFDAEDLEFSERMSAAMSLAMGNARLFEAERRRARLGEALAEASSAVHSSLERDEVIRRALAEGARALGADTGALSIHEGSAFRVAYTFGFPKDITGTVIPDEREAHSVLALETRQPVIVEDVRTDDRVDTEHVLSYGIGAVIVVPLIVGGVAAGNLYYNFAEPRRFSPQETQFAVQLASTLSSAVENARLFEAVRENEARYRGLFEGLIDGFALHEIVLDDRGVPTDYVFLEANEAFERLTGLSVSGIVGRRVTEVIPGIESDPADWIGRYGRVALTGEPTRFEQHAEALGKWFSVSAYSPERGRFVTVFEDITDRKTAEERVLRHAEVEERMNAILHSALIAPSEGELAETALAAAIDVTRSAFGFLGEIGPDGLMHDTVISGVGWELCAMRDKSGHRRKPGSFEIHGLYGRVLAEGKALLTNEPAGHPDRIGTPEGHPALTAFLGVPLVSEDRTIGMIAVANREGGYTADDREALETLAPAIVEAFERKRAEDALARTSERLRLLSESARLLLESRKPERAVQTIAEQVMAYLRCDAFFNYVIEDGGERMRLNAYGGVPEEEASRIRHLDIGAAVCGCVARDGTPIVAEDIQHRDDERTALVKSLGIQAYACHPLVYQGETIGTLSFGTRDRTAFTADELELMEVVADQAATAMARKKAEDRLRDARARLEATARDLNRAQAVAHVGSWRVYAGSGQLFWSDETYRIFGIVPGTPMTYEAFLARVHPDDRDYLDACWTAALSGEPYDIQHRILVDGEVKWVHEQAELEFDDEGQLVGGFGTVQDVTERKAAEELESWLNRIRSRVGATLDVGQILDELLTLGARALGAEAAVLALLSGEEWVVSRIRGRIPEASLGVRATDEESVTIATSVSERRAIVLDLAAADASLPILDALRAEGMRSLLTVPLIAQGRPLGALGFARATAARFADNELAFASRLINVAGLALDNAKLYERERSIADALQEAILTPPPRIEGIEVSYIYRPASRTANVGGDLYDVFPIDADRIGLLIGDVSGKGLEAARLTSLVRDGIRAYSYEHDEPSGVLEHLNKLVYRSSPVEAFTTVFFNVLDRHSGCLRYAAAAHPSGIVLGEERVELLKESGKGPVGAFEETSYVSEEARLRLGETLVLYTDGITEARRDGELFGEARLVEVLRGLRDVPLEDLPDRILSEVLAFCGGTLRDDTIVMCVRWTGTAGAE